MQNVQTKEESAFMEKLWETDFYPKGSKSETMIFKSTEIAIRVVPFGFLLLYN